MRLLPAAQRKTDGFQSLTPVNFSVDDKGPASRRGDDDPIASPRRDVLVVDDDAAIRQLLHTVFRYAGLSCDTACDGLEALEQLAKARYAIMLLDLMMPRLDGHGVLTKLRALSLEAREYPMVFLVTAAADNHDFGGDCDLVQMVIRKPFDIRAVGDLVHDCVSARRDVAIFPPQGMA